MKRWIGWIVVIWSLLLSSALPAHAAQPLEFRLSAPEEVAPGEQVNVSGRVAGGKGETIAAFRMYVTFDRTQLEFDGLQPAGETTEGDYRINEQDDRVVILYLSEVGGVPTEPSGETEFFTLRFSVREDARDEETSIGIQWDGLSGDDLKELTAQHSSDAVVRVVTPDYSLRTLQPSTGRLTPDFAPQIYQYTMDVPYEVSRLTFHAEAYNPDAVVKISRQTLEKAGTRTLVQITVRSQDGKIQSTYEVQVYRRIRTASEVSSTHSASSGRPSGQTGTGSSRGDVPQSRQPSSMEDGAQSSSDTSDGWSGFNQTISRPVSESSDAGGEESRLVLTGNNRAIFWLVLAVAAVVLAVVIFLCVRFHSRKGDDD